MKHSLGLFIVLVFTLLSFTKTSLSQDIIDLNKFTFNGLNIQDLNIEVVTNILGRPTATNNNPIAPELVKITGAQIYYHDKGLMFWFKPESQDPQKRIFFIDVYIVKTWDKENDELITRK